jgi:hypothetical protein
VKVDVLQIRTTKPDINARKTRQGEAPHLRP